MHELNWGRTRVKVEVSASIHYHETLQWQRFLSVITPHNDLLIVLVNCVCQVRCKCTPVTPACDVQWIIQQFRPVPVEFLNKLKGILCA